MLPYGKNRCELRNKKKRKIEGNRREGERKKEHEAKEQKEQKGRGFLLQGS